MKGQHTSHSICVSWSAWDACQQGLCRLHHYISAWPAVRSAWGFAILHNCIPLLSSALVGSPLPLSPYHLLYTLQLSVLSTLPSLLCGFLCQPFLPSNSYWLTNAVRWIWLACTLHKQPVCSYLGPFKTPRLHCHTHLHEIKHTQQCWTSLTHARTHTRTHTHTHSNAFAWTWRTHL